MSPPSSIADETPVPTLFRQVLRSPFILTLYRFTPATGSLEKV
ncbi:hypothetical protein JMA_18840 [Jeotgalibacillus malaysiensis]|uniref:Uncharacterized protein n=1 Tax=Jeotgalibacillus malaysiensis TaxID=1508404 RepID=A0A0B5AM32_9BACL|nr:hypothetical protein JMA_18840 [Jeotgalibacillus malaysiensis]